MSRYRFVSLAAVLALAAACSGPSTITTISLPSASSHLATVGAGSLTAATLDVDSGTTALDISTGGTGGHLMTAATPLTSNQRPDLTLTSDHVVHLQLASTGSGGAAAVLNVVLDPAVVWTIDLDGGASEERVDLSGGQLAELDLAAGATREVVSLPAPHGTQIVHEAGGASDLTVSIPTATATEVEVGGGASSVAIRGRTHSGVAGGTVFADPGYANAPNRIDLELQGGVSSVTVMERT